MAIFLFLIRLLVMFQVQILIFQKLKITENNGKQKGLLFWKKEDSTEGGNIHDRL